jgi:hypothetical protein
MSHMQHKVALWRRSVIYEYFMKVVILVQMFAIAWEESPKDVGVAPHETIPVAIKVTALVLLSIDILLDIYARTFLGYLAASSWNVLYFITLVIQIVCAFIKNYYFDFAFLRPLLLVSRTPRLKRGFTTIFKTLPDTFELWYTFLCLLLFYAGMGKLLFQGLYDFETCDVAGLNVWNVFDRIGSGIFGLVVLTTTENYPSIMYPSYVNGNHVLALAFHFSYVIFVVFFIMPIMLAVVYDKWNDVRLESARNNNLRKYQALIAAYEATVSVSKNNKVSTLRRPGMHNDECNFDMALWSRLVHIIQPSRTPEEAQLMFNFMDDDSSGVPSRVPFLRVPFRHAFLHLPSPQARFTYASG